MLVPGLVANQDWILCSEKKSSFYICYESESSGINENVGEYLPFGLSCHTHLPRYTSLL